MSEASAPDERLAIVLAESLRAIAEQEQALERVRQRATGVLAAAGLAAAFVGGLAERGVGTGLGPAAYVALGAFVVLALAVAWILQPRKFDFISSPRILLKWVDGDYTLDEMRRHLATDLEDQYDKNEKKIDKLGRVFQGASLLLAIEIVALLIDLRGR